LIKLIPLKNYKVVPLSFIIFTLTLFSQQYVTVTVNPAKKEFLPTENIKINVKADIQSGFHINSNLVSDEDLIPTTLSVDSDNFKLTNISWPKAKKYKFSFSETELDVFEGTINITFNLKPNKNIKPGNYEISGRLNYQACNDRACFAPRDAEFTVNVRIKEDTVRTDILKSVPQDTLREIDTAGTGINKTDSFINTSGLTENPSVNNPQTSGTQNEIAQYIEKQGIALALIFIFGIGLALNLTPCVYPLIPITISYFGAQVSNSHGKKIFIAILYVLGMSVTYSVLGVSAALTGGVFGSILQSPVTISVLVIIFILLALGMFGLYEIRLPQGLMSLGAKNREGYIGSFIMGLTVGFIAAPCIGPLVLSLLVYVGTTGDPLTGFVMFFVLSLGLGFPYIFLAMFSSSINKLPRSGAWMEGVKIIFGIMMLGLALYTAQPLISSKIYEILFPLFLILSGIYLILFDRKALNSQGYTKIKFVIALIAVIWGSSIFPGFGGYNKENVKFQWNMLNSLNEINQSIANSNGKPTMIDFYADWCAQCKELDRYTFIDPKVIELGNKFNNIKVDLTKGDKEIESKFRIQGLPVVAFIDREGREIEELRVTGFVPADEFTLIMQTALNK
jgi:thiol:disulfide interchange protein DsbD